MCNTYNTNMPPRQLSLALSDQATAAPSPQHVARSMLDRSNHLDAHDQAFHNWYRFVLSFPPHLVRTYLEDFGLHAGHVLLDPFCGTGTTLVEAKLHGIPSVGLEANPFAQFASSVKLDWSIDADRLIAQAHEIAAGTYAILRTQGVEDDWHFVGDLQQITLQTLPTEAARLIISNSISPLPLHKALVLLDCLRKHHGAPYYHHVLLAFAKALVFRISNLHFGPEVGVGKAKTDLPVVRAWLSEVGKIAQDIRRLGQPVSCHAEVHLADARHINGVLPPHSVDAVITSPPYPNEKDYTRTTRLESVMLGLINTKEELRRFKQKLVRSNTRGVYKTDDDDQWIAHHEEIQRIAALIEQRRIAMGKTSGFERMYSKVTRLYFGGMACHLAELRTVLRPGARLAYVVGDQASYLQVMIRTGHILADLAQSLGYELVRIDLFRTRFATATKEQLREEVVILHWPG